MKKNLDLNKDFEELKREDPWVIKSKSEIHIETYQDFELSDEFKVTFPEMSLLVRQARVSSILIDKQPYYLFAWDHKEGKACGWLNKVEEKNAKWPELIPEHETILRNIGGIAETFNEPFSFTNNQWFLFIGSQCSKGINDYDDYYSDACQEEGFEEINYYNFVAFAKEANGASTVYDPDSKKVFLFSHDHCFKNVEPVKNQPEYTFHIFKEINNFRDYVEELAVQWLSCIK